jgi:putative flippase GtrA
MSEGISKMAKNNKHNKKLIIQFIQYMISGGAYFWVGYAILLYLFNVQHWSLWWSTIASNVIGWSVNFVMQRFWVFNNKSLKGHQTQVTGRYIVITLVDFVLNYFILYGLNRVGIKPAIGQFVSSGFFTVWNYLWYRFWVFPEKTSKKKRYITATRVVAHRAHGHMAYHRV